MIFAASIQPGSCTESSSVAAPPAGNNPVLDGFCSLIRLIEEGDCMCCRLSDERTRLYQRLSENLARVRRTVALHDVSCADYFASQWTDCRFSESLLSPHRR
jgi:hypothetical protein